MQMSTIAARWLSATRRFRSPLVSKSAESMVPARLSWRTVPASPPIISTKHRSSSATAPCSRWPRRTPAETRWGFPPAGLALAVSLAPSSSFIASSGNLLSVGGSVSSAPVGRTRRRRQRRWRSLRRAGAVVVGAAVPSCSACCPLPFGACAVATDRPHSPNMTS